MSLQGSTWIEDWGLSLILGVFIGLGLIAITPWCEYLLKSKKLKTIRKRKPQRKIWNERYGGHEEMMQEYLACLQYMYVLDDKELIRIHPDDELIFLSQAIKVKESEQPTRLFLLLDMIELTFSCNLNKEEINGFLHWSIGDLFELVLKISNNKNPG